MQIFGFETIDSLPALYHPGLDMIVISDLHLGLEKSVTSEGGYVPRFQLEGLKEDLEFAKDETGASRILVNGDLKHEFSHTKYSEKEEIEEFISFLKRSFEEVIVVEGNHDTFIEDLMESKQVNFLESYLEGGILFCHGHDAMKVEGDFETLVIGHEHPALVLEDEVGFKEKVDCFLHGEMNDGKKIIVLPAFSQISGGSKVNQVPSSELLSPVLKNMVDTEQLEAVAVSREAGLFEFPEIGKI